MKTFTLNMTNKKSVLTAYVHDRSRELPNADMRPAVLVFPGGGYMFCSDREADPVALAYAAEGYNAFVLRYTTGLSVPASDAFADAEEALAYLCKNSDVLNIDTEKIALVGFSAGGHLAAWVSTYGSIKPAAAILGYPCILPEMGDLMGKELPDLCKKVDSSTPPTFIFTTRDDTVVPARHSLKYAEALDSANVDYELHVFGEGAHGLSLARTFTSSGRSSHVNEDVAQWFGLSINWLKRVIGDFEVSHDTPQADDDALSVATPLEKLMSNDKARALVLEALPQIADIIKQAEESGQLRIINAAPIKDIARIRPELLDAESVKTLNEQLLLLQKGQKV